MKINATVIATPLSRPFTPYWVVECSKCGPLGVAPFTTVDDLCALHLSTHAAVSA